MASSFIINDRPATALRTSDFHYDLPEALIAQHPMERRDASRLMVLDREKNTLEHKHFYDIVDYLRPEDVLVINDSKVNVTNLDGRVFFRGNYTISGTSDIDLSGITKAGFRIEAGQTLTIADTATVDIAGVPRDGGIHLTDTTATYTVADTALTTCLRNRRITPAACQNERQKCLRTY